MRRYQADHLRLVNEIERIHEAGEPLDGGELNSWYEIPVGHEDRTVDYLAAFGELPNIPRNFREAAGNLPYVGSTQEDPPLPLESWIQLADAEAFLEKYRDTLAAIHNTTSRPGRVRFPVDFRQGMETPLFDLGKMVLAVRLLRLQAICNIHRGDHRNAIANIIAMFRARDALEMEPTAVGQTARVFCQSSGIYTFLYLLKCGPLSEAYLQQVNAVAATTNFERSYYHAMLGERALAYQTIAGTVEDFNLSIRESNLASTSRSKTVLEYRPGDCATLLRLTTDTVEAAKQPYPAMLREQNLASYRARTLIAKDANSRWKALVVTSLLYVGDRVFFDYATQAETELHSLQVLIAVERYRAHHSRLPQHASDLIPEYLLEIPADPCGKKELNYGQLDGGYVVYGIGTDGVDNLGDVSTPTKSAPDFGLRLDSVPLTTNP